MQDEDTKHAFLQRVRSECGDIKDFPAEFVDAAMALNVGPAPEPPEIPQAEEEVVAEVFQSTRDAAQDDAPNAPVAGNQPPVEAMHTLESSVSTSQPHVDYSSIGTSFSMPLHHQPPRSYERVSVPSPLLVQSVADAAGSSIPSPRVYEPMLPDSGTFQHPTAQSVQPAHSSNEHWQQRGTSVAAVESHRQTVVPSHARTHEHTMQGTDVMGLRVAGAGYSPLHAYGQQQTSYFVQRPAHGHVAGHSQSTDIYRRWQEHGHEQQLLQQQQQQQREEMQRMQQIQQMQRMRQMQQMQQMQLQRPHYPQSTSSGTTKDYQF